MRYGAPNYITILGMSGYLVECRMNRSDDSMQIIIKNADIGQPQCNVIINAIHNKIVTDISIEVGWTTYRFQMDNGELSQVTNNGACIIGPEHIADRIYAHSLLSRLVSTRKKYNINTRLVHYEKSHDRVKIMVGIAPVNFILSKQNETMTIGVGDPPILLSTRVDVGIPATILSLSVNDDGLVHSHNAAPSLITTDGVYTSTVYSNLGIIMGTPAITVRGPNYIMTYTRHPFGALPDTITINTKEHRLIARYDSIITCAGQVSCANVIIDNYECLIRDGIVVSVRNMSSCVTITDPLLMDIYIAALLDLF
jgi:hypothetical protein